MDVKMEALYKENGTWELMDLLEGEKIIGVKQVHKTKFDENGKVNKHKARLEMKGYAQQHGMDYNEVFAHVERMETIRLVIAIVAQKGLSMQQLNVKSAFLHSELNENVFMEQLCGYMQKGEEQKVINHKRHFMSLNKHCEPSTVI